MKISLELAQELFDEGTGTIEDGFKVVERGEWIDDHKYENSYVIVQHIESQLYYTIDVCRSGSNFSDWYYEWGEDKEKKVEIMQVRPFEVTHIEWQRI